MCSVYPLGRPRTFRRLGEPAECSLALTPASDCGERRLRSANAQPVGDFKAAVVVWRSKAKAAGGYTGPGGVRERPHGELAAPPRRKQHVMGSVGRITAQAE